VPRPGDLQVEASLQLSDYNQLLDGRTSGNGGAAPGREDLRRGLNSSQGWPRIVERSGLKFLKDDC